VFEHYAQNANTQYKAIAAMLHRLRQRRNRADYDDHNIQQVEALTRNVLHQTRQVFMLLQQL
jgi:hypothetical protein